MTRFWPSTQPRSRSSPRRSDQMKFSCSGPVVLRTPMRYSFPTCCASVASGAASSPPAKVPRNERRSMSPPSGSSRKARERDGQRDDPTPTGKRADYDLFLPVRGRAWEPYLGEKSPGSVASSLSHAQVESRGQGGRHGTSRAGKGTASTGEDPAAADTALRASHQERQSDMSLFRHLSRPVLFLVATVSERRL